MAKHKKPAPAAKKPAAKPAPKPAPKKGKSVPAKKPDSKSAKPAEKKPETKSTKPAAKPAMKEESSSKSRAPMPAPEKVAEKKSGKTTPPIPASAGKSRPPIETKAASAAKPAGKSAKVDARELLRNRILGAKKATKPIAFTLEEAKEIAKTAVPTKAPFDATPKQAKAAKSGKTDLSKLEKPAAPNHVKAASLADILGFNPKKAQKPSAEDDAEEVPEKFRRYYKLLLDLRNHLTEGLSLHTEETLKRSAKDDAGDLSSYGQHMADAGTDTFDRDFALSLVSSEQEALTEIDAAIKRIKTGTYGICEVTQKPIAKERLTAVPFTRYSAEAQKDIERNRMRTRSAAGLFGEMGEEGGRIADDDGGGDE